MLVTSYTKAKTNDAESQKRPGTCMFHNSEWKQWIPLSDWETHEKHIQVTAHIVKAHECQVIKGTLDILKFVVCIFKALQICRIHS